MVGLHNSTGSVSDSDMLLNDFGVAYMEEDLSITVLHIKCCTRSTHGLIQIKEASYVQMENPDPTSSLIILASVK